MLQIVLIGVTAIFCGKAAGHRDLPILTAILVAIVGGLVGGEIAGLIGSVLSCFVIVLVYVSLPFPADESTSTVPFRTDNVLDAPTTYDDSGLAANEENSPPQQTPVTIGDAASRRHSEECPWCETEIVRTDDDRCPRCHRPI